MSASSSPLPDPTPAHQRLKLNVNTTHHLDHVDEHAATSTTKDGSGSPTRPSYSPVTPTLSQAALFTQHDTKWVDEPLPLPVSLDENPDAIALKATLSILQMQRQQSLNDIRKLERIKREAQADPESFVEGLMSGKLRTHSDRDMVSANESEMGDKMGSKFEALPEPQNIVRCPPIEWAKYNVVGEALNTLHEVQQRYPGITHDALARGAQPQLHEIAAPYRPFVDKVEQAPDSKNLQVDDKK